MVVDLLTGKKHEIPIRDATAGCYQEATVSIPLDLVVERYNQHGIQCKAEEMMRVDGASLGLAAAKPPTAAPAKQESEADEAPAAP